MKKIFLSLFALALTFAANAQTNLTFQVDVSRLIAEQGGSLLPAGMRIAGTFGTVGATTNGVAMLDWSPNDTTGKMTDLGNNIWSINVTVPDAIVGSTTSADSLQFKFVDGTWDPTGTNEGHGAPGVDDTIKNEGCAPAATGNRTLGILPGGGTYRYCYDHCAQCDGTPALITGVQTVNNKIPVFSLTPNPASNGQTTLMYSITEYSPVTVTLIDVMGQAVKTFVNTNRPAGLYNQTINLNNLSTGVYFLRLTSGNQTVTKRIVL